MTNTIRIKRRSSAGALGAPSSLANAELAFNEADDTLYYGKGTGGANGTATTVEAIGGSGAYVTLNTTQVITGNKTFTGGINATITGNAATATALQTARTITLTTDASGSTSFDGSSNVTIPLTLSNSGVTAGTYGSSTQAGVLSIDGKGRVTSASNVGIAFPVTSVNTLTGAVVLTTTNINEGTNLYYTDTRVRANRLDQLSVPTSAVSLNSQRLTNVADPTANQDSATKAYVDAVAQGAGNAPFTSVRAIATTSITLSGLQTIDGVALVAGDRVLVTGNGTANGFYTVGTGAWVRTLDADSNDEFRPGKQVFINEGTQFEDTTWAITNNGSITLGTSILTFSQISGLGQVTAGVGLTKTGNTISAVVGTGITTTGGIGLTGQALSLHNLNTTGFIGRTSGGSIVSRSITISGNGLSISNGDGSSGNPVLSLTTSLSTIGSLTPLTDTIPYYTSGSAAALTTLTSTGRSFMSLADIAAGRTLLGLGTMALQNANAVAITGGTLSSVTISNSVIDGGTF